MQKACACSSGAAVLACVLRLRLYLHERMMVRDARGYKAHCNGVRYRKDWINSRLSWTPIRRNYHEYFEPFIRGMMCRGPNKDSTSSGTGTRIAFWKRASAGLCTAINTAFSIERNRWTTANFEMGKSMTTFLGEGEDNQIRSLTIVQRQLRV
jgi:hypothetical protein